MTIQTLKRAELCLSLPADALGFGDTSELVQLPLPWVGQTRVEQAARFGLGLEQPHCTLFTLGEVGSGRSSLLLQSMQTLTLQLEIQQCCLSSDAFKTEEERLMNEALAALCRQSVKPLLERELQGIRLSLNGAALAQRRVHRCTGNRRAKPGGLQHVWQHRIPGRGRRADDRLHPHLRGQLAQGARRLSDAAFAQSAGQTNWCGNNCAAI